MGENVSVRLKQEMLRTHWVAWTIVGLTVVINAVAVWLGLLDRSVQSLTATLMFTVVTIGFASIGALIVTWQRGNRIGWLFIGMAMFLAVPHNLLQNYAVYAMVVAPGTLPGGMVAYWFSSSIFDGVFVMVMSLLLLLFPDGHPLSPRWRPAVWCAVLGAVCTFSQGFTEFTSAPPLDGIANPVAISGTGASVLQVINAFGIFPSLIGFGAGVASIVLRFRRSAGVERQQVKWIMAAVLFEAVLVVVTIVLSLAGVGGDLSGLSFVLAIVLFPVLIALGDSPLPAVRHRCGDPKDAGVRLPDCAAGAALPRRDRASGGGVSPGDRAVGCVGRDPLHAAGGVCLPAASPPHPARGRSPLLAPHLRRGGGGAGLHRPPARTDRSGRALP